MLWQGWMPPFLRKRYSPHLLLFFHETTWSGAPIQLFHLATWLRQKGWELSAIVPKTNSPQSGPIVSHLAALGIEIFPILDWSVAPNLEALRALCAQFDCVIANTLVMWAAVRAANDTATPVIWYIHETLLLWRLLEISPEIRPTLALPDLLVTPTEHTAQLYRPLTKRPIAVVPYGIPPVQIRPQPNREPSRTHFLLLGSCEHRKGQDLFLEGISRLPDGLKDLTRFEMIGRALDEPFYENLLQAAAAYPNVRLGHELQHDDALAAIARADVLVCASRDETMPVAILEAMSLGKAIITTDVGGTTEWLRDEMNALIVPVDDSRALAAAIQRCVEEPDLLCSLGRNARQTFLAQFSLDQLGRRFARLIRRLRKEKRP